MPDSTRPVSEFESDKLLLKLKKTISCRVEEISPVVEEIMKEVREMTCAAGKEFEVETALREALANAIVHGCRNVPEGHVEVCVACDESRGMLIIVDDPGEGFDPSSLPSPVVGQNIFSSHGRGIFLINTLMDEVHYERGGTEIRMRKK